MSNLSTPLIVANNLWKAFHSCKDTLPIIRGLDFSLSEGESVTLMGDSGSGKSTFLNLLSGLESLDEGDLLWRGESVKCASLNDLAKMRRSFIGFIFQSFHLIPDLNVYENIYLSARISSSAPRLERRDLKEKIEAHLVQVGLGGRSHQSVKTLSGGEKQRVAIARATVNEPSVLFADEPTGNLDDSASEEIMALLLNTVCVQGTSLVLVTHNPKFAELTDRALFLKNGRFDG